MTKNDQPDKTEERMEDREKMYDDYAEKDEDSAIDEYDITVTPNDFNVETLKNLVDRGSIRIPGFQRNYVWDLVRASKLIESLILGLPVPQLFLYQQERNSYLLIDGQQRLMSVHYFLEQRFPRPERRVDLRRIFNEKGSISKDILDDNQYFWDFSLRLPESLPSQKNRLGGLTYDTLSEDDKFQFDQRTIRCIVVKQNSPSNDDTSMYEIFNRLNTGGINLRPQEIRTSMYHSEFYVMLNKVNSFPGWRKMTSPTPDIHMKDVEILLRGFAMLIDGENYAPSMVRFLNQFSRQCKEYDFSRNKYLEDLFESFLGVMSPLSPAVFKNESTNRFNIALYESIFTAVCKKAYKEERLVRYRLNEDKVAALRSDEEFLTASLQGTTSTANVGKRLTRANAILNGG